MTVVSERHAVALTRWITLAALAVGFVTVLIGLLLTG